jgi:hypothetical protein
VKELKDTNRVTSERTGRLLYLQVLSPVTPLVSSSSFTSYPFGIFKFFYQLPLKELEDTKVVTGERT